LHKNSKKPSLGKSGGFLLYCRDQRSLSRLINPAAATHRQRAEGARREAGAGPDVVRLSVGIEHVDDIIADLEQALAAI